MNETPQRPDCPYVGLQPFEEQHQAYFFGREREQRLIISNLLAAPLTILYGSSGVGKSSVLMAGVIPQLRRDRPKTPVIMFRNWARSDCAEMLASACVEATWEGARDQPKPSLSMPLDEILRACAEAAHATVLVILDQFEEYFLYHAKTSDPDSFEVAFARAVNREDVDVGFLVAFYEIFHDVLAPAILDWSARYVQSIERERAVKEAREAAKKRSLRWVLMATVGMLSIALVGLVVVFNQSREVERLRRQAEANRKAAEAILASASDPIGALRLALEAADETRKANESLEARAEDALRWTVQRPRLDRTLDLGSQVFDLAYHPVHPWLAVGTEAAAEIWDLQTHQRIRSIPHEGWVWKVTFDTTSNRLLTAAGKSAYLWSLDDPAAPPIRFVHGDRLFQAVALSRDGQWLATAGDKERLMKIWDVTAPSGEPIKVVNPEGARVAGLDFTPDGCCIATAAVERGGKGRSWNEIWSIASGAKILSVPSTGPGDAVTFTPDHKALVAVYRDDRVRVWRPVVGELDAIIAARADQSAQSPLVRPTGTLAEIPPVSVEPDPILWTVRVLIGHVDRIRNVAADPTGARLASVSADNSARVWDAETGESLFTLVGHRKWIEGVAFSIDGQKLLTGGRDGQVRIWDVASHTGSVNGIAFSHDGKSLATASGDRTVKVWNLGEDGLALRWTLNGHTDAVYRAAFDPSGTRLASAGLDNRVRLWDIGLGRELRGFSGHRDQLRDVAFSGDGVLLLVYISPPPVL